MVQDRRFEIAIVHRPSGDRKIDVVPSIYDFSVTAADGSGVDLSTYRGRVLLIVNVASRCGFTPQYRGLETLYRKHRDEGFAVLGFPCNQFGAQEPGTNAEIQEFCRTNYEVTFPVFGKFDVNGPGADPLFAFLKSQKKGLLGSESIKWNFTKFLVDRAGQVIRRFAPNETPDAIEPHVRPLLAAPVAAGEMPPVARK
jgi:glutathione peroxidase